MSEKKIRIAFIKFGGLAAGGTEKFLQTIAAHLDRSRFEVDYFYCAAAPYIGSNFIHATTDPDRLAYMKKNNVNLIEFKVGAKDVTKRTHDWVDTNFWDLFKENNYDIIQTGRAGHPEYPFIHIKNTPISDSLHLSAGVDNQFNISRVMHITSWSAKKWINMGGDKKRVVIVSHPMDIPDVQYASMRENLGIKGKFVFGFHQRADDNIFSPIPIQAYKAVENDNTFFILMGGGEKYREQAKKLGIQHIYFIDHTADQKKIYSFLSTLDVYAHGRKDGEVNSTAMAEAMYFGLPILSHISSINNGHIECIGNAGKVVTTVTEYIYEMNKLMDDKNYLKTLSSNAKKRFQEKYLLAHQINNIEKIYEEIIKDPFPNKIRRFVTSFRLRFYTKKLFSIVRNKIFYLEQK